ncbi:3-oxoacyl-ACP synthase III family protein [Viridibacillus sp. NPDC096237]|uniref:3-oxoacyl-ACP synthase III family protein n=1 Tax=Viridibacillus sp. NPDC096237 TaxID=3390721 RepID=UPI003CFC7BB5
MSVLIKELPQIVNKTGLTYGVGIKGTGMYVPDKVITNQFWEERLETTSEWIEKKTGIIERRHLSDIETTSDMCIAASVQALSRANVKAHELDAIIIATITPDYPLPSTALIVKEALGASRAITLDLTQVACSGLVYGMHVGAHFLQNKKMTHVLVIGSDALSRIYNPNERGSCVFFGDACGAMILQRTKDPSMGILAWDINSKLNFRGAGISHGGASNTLTHESLDRGQHYLYMNGQEVWKEATTVLPSTLQSSIKNAELKIEEVDFFILHQANAILIKEVLKTLNIDERKALFNVSKHGNTGAGTMPTVLHEAIIKGEIKDGDIIAFAGIGAGFNWGSLVMKYSSNSEDFE